MGNVKYFYSASTMGYGAGRFWHSKFNFPNFPRVTKTITLNPRMGIPFAVIKYGKSVWNHIGLHNVGIDRWLNEELFNSSKDIILSIYGTSEELNIIGDKIEPFIELLRGIELNFSCPNVNSLFNEYIPPMIHYLHSLGVPLYLKLRYDQDPYKYDLDIVDGIRLNSIPARWGGLSGKAAQKKNWGFIQKFNKEGLNIAGCSFVDEYDLKRLEDMGCKEIGIGSTILINPTFVESLR